MPTSYVVGFLQNSFKKNITPINSVFLPVQMLSAGVADIEPMLRQAMAWEMPDMVTVRAIIRLAWASSSGGLELLNATPEELHAVYLPPHGQEEGADLQPDTEDVLGESEV